MQSIYTRRSVRQYKDIKIEKEKTETLLRAAMQAPSAGNQQPWEFIVVEDKDKLKELSNMSPYTKLIANAPLAIVILGNEERMRFPENWEQDLGAATQNLLLQAVDLELGAVWMSAAPLRERMEYVTKTFCLKETLKPYCVVAIGYPLDEQGNKFIDRFDTTRIHYL